MSAIQLFEFEGHQIEWGQDDNGNPICEARQLGLLLGFSSSYISEIVSRIYPQFKFQSSMGKPGRPSWYLREPGVYQMIFESKSDIAQRFQCWVFEEVLPKLRRTGEYSLKSANASPAILPAIDPSFGMSDVPEVLDFLFQVQRLGQVNKTLRSRLLELHYSSGINQFKGRNGVVAVNRPRTAFKLQEWATINALPEWAIATNMNTSALRAVWKNAPDEIPEAVDIIESPCFYITQKPALVPN